MYTTINIRLKSICFPRTVILMVFALCAGGTIAMENPANSLVAAHGRFAWLVALLKKHDIAVTWLS